MGSDEVRYHCVPAHNGTSDDRETRRKSLRAFLDARRATLGRTRERAGCGHLRTQTHSRVKSQLRYIGLQRGRVARVSPGRTVIRKFKRRKSQGPTKAFWLVHSLGLTSSALRPKKLKSRRKRGTPAWRPAPRVFHASASSKGNLIAECPVA